MAELNDTGGTITELSPDEAKYFETGGMEAPVQEQKPDPAPEEKIESSVDEAVDPPRDERGKFVPHQALHQERMERKKAQEELQTLRERQAILEDRWNTILKVQEQPAEEAKGPPNPDEDIFGYMKWQGEQLNKLQQERESEVKQRQEYEQQTQAEQEINNYWNQSVQEYISREPEFEKVAQWTLDARHKYWKAMGHVDPRFKDDNFRNAHINQEVKAITSAARQNGQNAAEIIHSLAREWGYTGDAQVQTSQVNNTLASLEAAQKASRTLAASGGKSGSDPLTPEAIASMSNEEFAQWSADPANQKRFERMLKGGA